MTSKFIIARKIFCATVSVIILSCAGNQDKVQDPQAEYDSEHLERPPQIVVYSAEKEPESIPAEPGAQETMDEPAQQTYNPNVMLSEMAGSDTKIIISELFSKSWSMVSKALTEKSFSVSDLDRDNGLFYVKYNPAAQDNNDKSLWDNIVSFLVKAGSDKISLREIPDILKTKASYASKPAPAFGLYRLCVYPRPADSVLGSP